MSKKKWIWILMWFVIMPALGALSLRFQFEIFNVDGKLGDLVNPLHHLVMMELIAFYTAAIFVFALFVWVLTYGLLARLWFGRDWQSADSSRSKLLMGIVLVIAAIVIPILPIQYAFKWIWVAALPEFIWIALRHARSKISLTSSLIPLDFWLLWATFSIWWGLVGGSVPNSEADGTVATTLMHALYFILLGLPFAVFATPWVSILKVIFDRTRDKH